ncbi:MAG: DUF1574 domain-containing protein [Ruminococcus sp.]|nr:DUF1574 domain-containing protein [Ruminococcus sp.]
MKSFIKHIVCVVLFVGILVGILFLVSKVVMPDGNNGIQDATICDFMREPENTVDVLVLGDSESYCSIIPPKIWNDYGISTFVCGTSSQKLYYTRELLKVALKTQQPKIVILEANAVFRKFSYSDIISNRFDRVFAVLRYHDRWKTLTGVGSGGTYTNIENSKGYRYSVIVEKPEIVRYVKPTDEVASISATNKTYVKEIADICEENGIKLIMISTPTLKNWNYRRHNALEKLAEKNGVEYIDMNLMEDEVPIDWENETRDKGDHLNYYGAVKVTDYLGKYLSETHLVSDHRNDAGFEQWNKTCMEFEEAKNALQIRNTNR